MPTEPFDLQAAYQSALATMEEHELAEATAAGYDYEWRHFEQWCFRAGLDALPAAPSAVQGYLIELLGASRLEDGQLALQRRSSRIPMVLSAIRWKHDRAGHAGPTNAPELKVLVEMLHRARQPRARSARPLTLEMVEHLHARPLAGNWERDITLVLLGFFGAFHGRDLLALRAEHLTQHDEGLVVFIPDRAAGRTGQGDRVAIAARDQKATCPVHQVRQYVTCAGISDGWLFPSNKRPGHHIGPAALNSVIRRLVSSSFGDPTGYTSHSLRRGFAVSADAAGEPLLKIAKKMRLATLSMALGHVAGSRVSESAVIVAEALGSL